MKDTAPFVLTLLFALLILAVAGHVTPVSAQAGLPAWVGPLPAADAQSTPWQVECPTGRLEVVRRGASWVYRCDTRDALVDGLMVATVAAAAMDVAMSIDLRHRGGREVNPVQRLALRLGGPVGLAALRGVSTAAAVALVQRSPHVRKRRAAWVVFAEHAAVVVWGGWQYTRVRRTSNTQ